MGKGTWVSLINYSPSILSSPPCGTTRDLLPIRSPLLSLFGFLIFGLKEREREREGGREGEKERSIRIANYVRSNYTTMLEVSLSLSFSHAMYVPTN